jgi:hypothetical protein
VGSEIKHIQNPWLGNVSTKWRYTGAAVELTSDDLREIEDASSKIKVQGARYPEELERRTGL